MIEYQRGERGPEAYKQRILRNACAPAARICCMRCSAATADRPVEIVSR
jgi:hypothetical protein